MKTRILRRIVCAAVVGVAFAAAGAASAQPPPGPPGPRPGPTNPPAVSPYLNLNRTGAPAAVNYYGLVRPQIDFRNAYLGLQQDFNQIQSAQTTDPRTGLPATGHAASFLNTGGYFMSLSSGLGQSPGQHARPTLQAPQQQQQGATAGGRGAPPARH